jgi:hypothetical protein
MQLRSAATDKRATIEVRYPTLASKHSQNLAIKLGSDKGANEIPRTPFLGFVIAGAVFFPKKMTRPQHKFGIRRK